jgi:hypothetical protein
MAGLTGFGSQITAMSPPSIPDIPRGVMVNNQKAFVKITEQTAGNKLRFR